MALALPGGGANPDFLWTVPAAVDFVTGDKPTVGLWRETGGELAATIKHSR